MFHADFPLQFQAGLHARPLGHLTNLGLTIDGKRLSADNPEMAEFEAPHSGPDRVVRVAADTGDPQHNQNLVKYAKATIQSGDGPFRHIVHPMSPAPEHVAAAMQSLEADPNWQPYVQLPSAPAVPQRQVAKVAAPGSAPWQTPHPSQPSEWSAVADPDERHICPHCGEKMGAHDYCKHCQRRVAVFPHKHLPEIENTKVSESDRPCLSCGEFDLRDGICATCRHDNGVRPKDFTPNDYNWQPVASAYEEGYGNTGDTKCPCGAKVLSGSKECKKCGRAVEADDAKAKGGFASEAGWHEADSLQQFQQDRGDFGQTPGGANGAMICPNCGTVNPQGSSKCMTCGTKLGLPGAPGNSGGPSNAYSNPYTGNAPTTGDVTGKMTRWHLADIATEVPAAQPQMDTVDGPYNDHRDVSEMSPEQAVGHERLVNIVVDEMNKAITGGAALDATLIQNLVQWLVDKFGQDADSAQAIVDAASKQAQTSDGRLDSPNVPDPAEQAIQPTQGDVVSDPSQTQNNGAFAHVVTPSGRVGHVTERWEDMYGEKYALVIDTNGFKESVFEDELEPVEQPVAENAVEELQSFLKELEPVEATISSVKARIANLRILKQEIRRHMTNPRLSMEQKMALDQMDADASVDMLALTDAVPQLGENEKSYLQSQPRFEQMVEGDYDVQPTLHGVDELQLDEPPAPEWTDDALDAFLPEEAEVMVSELSPHIRNNPEQLEAVAANHVDRLTAGHSLEDRARHRARFIASVQTFAQDYATTDEPDTTTTEEADHDGPAEGLFV